MPHFFYHKKIFLSLVAILITSSGLVYTNSEDENKQPEEISLFEKETMTPIEISYGDVVNYTRKDGKILTIELVSTDANILYTNRDKIPEDESGNDRGNMYRARLLYEITADILVNGHPMTMRKYVGSQQSLYEPYVINGVRVWFDAVSDIFEEGGGFINRVRSANGSGNLIVNDAVNKNARFIFQDMTSRITSGELHAWFKDGERRNENFIYKDNFIDVGRSYNGDDVFLGAYMGGEAHGALDIDMEMGTTIYAPFDMDTQSGIRAAGTKTWPDGSVWAINIGHIVEKYVPDSTSVKGGTALGKGAKRALGWHPHSHFGFEIIENDITYDIDAWTIFWQHFEDNKKRDGVLRAMMEPLANANTGETVNFKPVCHLGGKKCSEISYYWAFGDGGWSDEKSPGYTFANPGIYPVTLTIDDGKKLAEFTQHITVEGPEASEPVITLFAEDEPYFRPRPLDEQDVYGWDPKFVPHTVDFLARPSRPQPDVRTVSVENAGNGSMSEVELGIHYNDAIEWLNVDATGSGNNQQLEVGVNANGLPAGTYEAIVAVHSEGAVNSPQKFRVELTVPDQPPYANSIVVDDRDPEFYATPYFWVGHRYHGWGWPALKNAEGYNHFYLINGERDREGEFARFKPDLESAVYDIWLFEKTPYASGPPANNEPARFKVRVVHADGEETIWMEPEKQHGFFPRPHRGPDRWYWHEPQETRRIGEFRFEEGCDGYVEIVAEGSTGQVLVDAVRFLKVEDPE